MKKLTIFLFAFIFSFQSVLSQNNADHNYKDSGDLEKFITVDLEIKEGENITLHAMKIITSPDSIEHGESFDCIFKTEHFEYTIQFYGGVSDKKEPTPLMFTILQLSLDEKLENYTSVSTRINLRKTSRSQLLRLASRNHLEIFYLQIRMFTGTDALTSFMKEWALDLLDYPHEYQFMECEVKRWKKK